MSNTINSDDYFVIGLDNPIPKSTIKVSKGAFVNIKGTAYFDNAQYLVDSDSLAEAFGEPLIIHDSDEYLPGSVEITISINGVMEKKISSAGDFEISFSFSKHGNNSVLLEVGHDNPHNTHFNVEVEPENSIIALTNPPNKSKVAGRALNLAGTIEDEFEIKSMSCFVMPMKASFEINFEKDENINNFWNWKLSLENLESGVYPLEVYSKDAYGNITKKTFHITMDDVKPTTKIKIPTSSSNDPHIITWEGPGTVIEVSGETTDEDTNIKSISWKFDTPGTPESEDVDIVSDSSARSHEWSFKAVIPEDGWNEIVVIATDEVGNKEETRIYIDAQRNA